MPYRAMALVAAIVMTLSSPVLAQKKGDPTTDSIKLNSSRSNIYRNGQTTGGTVGYIPGTDTDRMGGGGGGKGAMHRMGGGGGAAHAKQ